MSLGERDKQISDVNHCEIIYDARNRKFFIQDKDSKNLTYVNDEAVLVPSVLDPLAHVRVGDTVFDSCRSAARNSLGRRTLEWRQVLLCDQTLEK